MRQILQLEDLNKAYEDAVTDVAFLCKKGCSSCCTRSVNMTTGEGRRIIQFLKDRDKSLPDLRSLQDIPVPACTTNHAAACYLDERFPPEGGEEPWNFLPCLFLENDECSIYPVRPFGCRSFGSVVPCRKEGTAEAPEWFITLNLFIMQIVENMDRTGFWGNMFEVLAYLEGIRGSENLLTTEEIPGFLIPEEDLMRVMSCLARVREIAGDDGQLQNVYTMLRRSITSR